MAAGTRSYEFARRLVRDGHEVHMVTSDRTGTKARNEVIDGIHVSWIPVSYSNEMSFARRMWAFLLFAVLATLEGIKTRPTVVFATSTPLTIVIPALIIKWMKRVPMVFEVRDLWPEMPIAVGALSNPVLIRIARGMEKIAYRQSKNVIALSPGMKDGIVATGYPETQVVVVPNGSDVESFVIDQQRGKDWLAKQDWYQGGKIVLYAGTLGLVNGVEYLVDVAKAARELEPSITFLIVGAGKESTEIRQKAEELGLLGHQVIMLGAMQKKEIPVVYSVASVATSLFRPIPEMENNSANKFFDALAAGIPVAINYGGWHERLLRENHCGLRLSRDPEKGAEELANFLNDQAQLLSAGSNAKQLAVREFARDKLYDDFLDVLVSSAG